MPKRNDFLFRSRQENSLQIWLGWLGCGCNPWASRRSTATTVALAGAPSTIRPDSFRTGAMPGLEGMGLGRQGGWQLVFGWSDRGRGVGVCGQRLGALAPCAPRALKPQVKTCLNSS